MQKPLKMLDLFAGIGGFSLAGHRMGWETAAFVEWEEFPQKVLAKNFPGVPIFGDIREFDGTRFIQEHGSIDIICGGFPCQPFSTAGQRKGRDDERHLWPEMLRVIRETRPSFVVGENVAGLVSMDGGDLLEEILLDLESEGYEVQPFIIPAISVGAPHRRDRIWIVAYSECNYARRTSRGLQAQDEGEELQQEQRMDEPCSAGEIHAGTNSTNASSQQDKRAIHGQRGNEECGRYALDDGEEATQQTRNTEANDTSGLYFDTADTESERLERENRLQGSVRFNQGNRESKWDKHWYETATEFCRVDDGLPGELDKLRTSNRSKRLKALGNAIVPQVAFEIFKAIENTWLCTFAEERCE